MHRKTRYNCAFKFEQLNLQESGRGEILQPPFLYTAEFEEMDARSFLDINIDLTGKLLSNNDTPIFRHHYDTMTITNNKTWLSDIKERLN